jgi:DNA repair protein RAD50
MFYLSADITFSTSQQRSKGATSEKGVKMLAIESTNAENFVQLLNKLNTIYEDYMKLQDESIPLAEKNLNQLLADESQKAETFDEVSFLLSVAFQFLFKKYCRQ